MKTTLLHLVTAGLLALLAWQLPTGAETRKGHALAEEQTRAAGRRVGVAENRLRQTHAERAKIELVCSRESLDAVAGALVALAAAFDPEPTRKLGRGLGETADYLDKQLVPTAERAADELDAASALLQTDTLRLAELLRVAPLDLDAIQQVHDALGKFAIGTEALHRILELSRLKDIRSGLTGLESSLSTAAVQVEHIAGFTYPVMRMQGWKPYVDYSPFWPQGDQVAAGMRDAAGGIKAADRELEAMGRDLPKVRAAVDSSRQILERSRDTLGVVLKHRELIEPLVKSLPETAARLAEDLPKLTRQFSATLRDTKHLKELARGLRESQAHLERTAASWPEIHQNLIDTAEMLRARRAALSQTLDHEASGATTADETRLDTLAAELEAVADIQAAQGETTARLLDVLRWSLLGAAGLVGICGCAASSSTGRKAAAVESRRRMEPKA